MDTRVGTHRILQVVIAADSSALVLLRSVVAVGLGADESRAFGNSHFATSTAPPNIPAYKMPELQTTSHLRSATMVTWLLATLAGSSLAANRQIADRSHRRWQSDSVYIVP